MQEENDDDDGDDESNENDDGGDEPPVQKLWCTMCYVLIWAPLFQARVCV